MDEIKYIKIAHAVIYAKTTKCLLRDTLRPPLQKARLANLVADPRAGLAGLTAPFAKAPSHYKGGNLTFEHLTPFPTSI
jgi:hypothetical protein